MVMVPCDSLQHQAAARSYRGGVDAVHVAQASHGLRRCGHVSRIWKNFPIDP